MTRKIQPINPFLPILKQPDPNPTYDPIELDESDVVWSDTRSESSADTHISISLSPPATSSPSPSSLSSSLSSSSLILSRFRLPPLSLLPLSPAPPPTPLLRRKSTVSAARFIPPAAAPGRRIPQSAPVTVPVWTRFKIWYHDDLTDDEEREGEERERGGSLVVPPHVMSGREMHVAAYSVFEGAGRTLKGRDLRRVRNAVFQKTASQVVLPSFAYVCKAYTYSRVNSQ